MNTTKYILALTILSLLVISGCSKQEPAPVYQPPVEQEKLIISLEKTLESGVTDKYKIYSTGRYVVSLINKNKSMKSCLKGVRIQKRVIDKLFFYSSGMGKTIFVVSIHSSLRSEHSTTVSTCWSPSDGEAIVSRRPIEKN